jgi:hypothetical protein
MGFRGTVGASEVGIRHGGDVRRFVLSKGTDDMGR